MRRDFSGKLNKTFYVRGKKATRKVFKAFLIEADKALMSSLGVTKKLDFEKRAETMLKQMS